MKEERKESESSDQPLDDPSLVSNVVDAESKQKRFVFIKCFYLFFCFVLFFHFIINFIHICRTWEQWSYEDKAIFFEALNECGKNFEAIQVYFQKNNKNKLRGLKNKDQIRTFYYRTWHKICKYVDFADDYKHLKKSSKELYSLINFGELRKRLGSQLDDKTGLKLRELIFKGHTSVKIKGKTHRLRTPTCLALKKLNEINGAGLNNSSSSSTTSSNSEIVDTSIPSPIVPCKLALSLSPASTEDFDRVHRLALANPNVTITSRPGKSLASIIEYLMQKWKSTLDDAELWIVPKPGVNFEHPDISVIGPVTSATLSLSSLKKDGDIDEDSINSRETNKSEQQQNDLNSITKLGWNIETAKSLSIGELFLIAGGGNESKIHLELNYTWKNPVTKSSLSSTNSTMSMLAKLALSELSKKKSQASAIVSSSAPRTAKSNNNNNNTLNGESSQIESTSTERLCGGDLDNNETHEFRRPTLPLSKTGIQQHQAFKQQIETLMPKYNMRKGRPLSRLKRPVLQPVSKRPLQPAPAMKSTEGQVKFRILPTGITLNHQAASSSSSPPVINVKPFGTSSTMTTPTETTTIAVVTSPPSSSSMNGTAATSVTSTVTTTSTTPTRNNIDLDPGNSNDSISSALAFFEPQAQNQRLTSKTDHFLDSVLENSNSSVLQTPPRVRPTPPTSPSRAVSNDSWIPDLSSFLNNIHSGGGGSSSNKDHHHQSRIINNDQQNKIVAASNEDSVQSNGSEVDRQLLSMMSESSVDFTSKFAKLASAVVGHEDVNVKDA